MPLAAKQCDYVLRAPCFLRAPWCALLVLLLALTLLSGCGGCRRSPAKAPPKKSQKEDYELSRLATNPYGLDAIESAMKPGHWTSSSLEAAANNFDFRGELATDPFALPGTAYSIGASRPAVLAKGQRKTMELTFFMPEGNGENASVSVHLRTRRGGGDVVRALFPLRLLPPHQYYFFVFARQADSYRFLRGLDCVTPAAADVVEAIGQAHYRVLTPSIERRVPLSANGLTWTNTAYVLWDDMDPGLFSPEQQQALVDWLHWGGRLIVVGPATLDLLKNSFLEPLMPANASEAVEITAAELEELTTQIAPGEPPLVLANPWSGVRLTAREGATVVAGTTEKPLMVERRAGRGLVSVLAFRLNERALVGWSGNDALVNALVLRRPGREFLAAVDGSTRWRWADRPREVDPFGEPERVCDVQYFTRQSETLAPHQESLFDERVKVSRNPKPGPAWSDTSVVSNAARDVLRQAAGISIPDSGFVLRMLGLYLLALVPANWLVFRVVGRVELAWATVPVLAIGFALAVVRLAQLDIGFARARTEIAVAELQGAYGRAHVTRYTALYTSLTTRYDTRFDDPTALVLPFASGSAALAQQSYSPTEFRRDALVRLSGFEVASNSIGMLHSEQMLDLAGGLVVSAAHDEVENRTGIDLRGAGVVGPRGTAWIGDLRTGARARLEFVAWPDEMTEADWAQGLWADRREQAVATRSVIRPGDLNVRPIIQLAQRRDDATQLRLIAWTEEALPGLSIDPAAAQDRHVTVVVSQLAYSPLALPEPDQNRRLDADRALRETPRPTRVVAHAENREGP